MNAERPGPRNLRASTGSSAKKDAAPDNNPDEYWRWCPRCGQELENQRCKFRCPRCHYFMSCSDFD